MRVNSLFKRKVTGEVAQEMLKERGEEGDRENGREGGRGGGVLLIVRWVNFLKDIVPYCTFNNFSTWSLEITPKREIILKGRFNVKFLILEIF